MTTRTRPAWIGKLHPSDPYDGVPAEPTDFQGWGSDAPIFKQVIEELRPDALLLPEELLLIEVGSWKGASAIHMADLMKAKGIHGTILCIDTWLGSSEQWLNLLSVQHGCLERYRVNGYPTGLYAQFVTNVVAKKHQDTIVPFPTTSSVAAKWLTHHRVQADAVYLDGGHEEDEVYADLKAYWPLVKEKGILFGDDFEAWPGVRAAIQRFTKELYDAGQGPHDVQVIQNKWVLRRSTP